MVASVSQYSRDETDAVRIADELLNLHRGQGMDLFWRENLICPTEAEYIDMVNNSAFCLIHFVRDLVGSRSILAETGGLFRIAIKLMMAASPESPPRCVLCPPSLLSIC